MKFKVGDRVKRKPGWNQPCGEGVVKYTNEYSVWVDFGTNFSSGHNLGGLIKTPTGWRCDKDSLMPAVSIDVTEEL